MNWYKIASELIKPVISYDFDDTIFSLEWNSKENDFNRYNGDPETIKDRDFKDYKKGDTLGVLNETIRDNIKKDLSNGNKVIIVTSRKEDQKEQVENFVRHHSLPISEIYCTNGQEKVYTLLSLGVKKHYDDDKYEIDAISENSNIEGVLV
jgi:uncharacterized HAD superfamily protein